MPRAWLGLLIAVLAVAALVRFLWLDCGWFGVDQGRDLAWAQAIAAGRALPIVGPLMRGRVHLAATYYYFWSLPALLSGRPIVAYAFAGLLGWIAVALATRVAWRLGDAAAAVATAALLATAPLAVIDSRVAWAPAALPPVVALFLLALHRLLERATPARAAAMVGVAALGVQLHLAAAPLLLVAAGALLVEYRRLGARGCATAGLVGSLVLAPLAVAVILGTGPSGRPQADLPDTDRVRDGTAPAAGATRSAPLVELRAHRLSDVLAVSARPLDGLSRPASERPTAVNLALATMRVEMPLTLVVACALLGIAVVRVWRSRRAAVPPGEYVPVAGAQTALTLADAAAPAQLTLADAAAPSACLVLACVAAVATLPGEAWYYYLDTVLVPGAVLLGLVLARVEPSRRGGIGVALLVMVLHGAVLAWWLGTVHAARVIPADLDYLRLGGPRPAGEGRARVLTLGLKQTAALVLTQDFGIVGDRLWRDVHGVGFTDLDTDNGFLLEAASRASPRAATTDPGASALVVYRGDFPAAWTSAFEPPRQAGPLELFRYRPVLQADRATVEGCASSPQALPARPVPDPLRYGFGAPERAEWPCPNPVAHFPVDATPSGVRLRVLARLEGGGSIRELGSEPPAEALSSTAPGAGMGLVLGADARAIRVALSLDGPANLDVYELHGVAPAATSAPRASRDGFR